MEATQSIQLDQGTFEAAFQEHYQALCRYVFRILRDEDQSEEIVQELFVKLWENRSKTQFTTSLRSYLFTAVHRSALDRLRHLKVRDDYQAYVIHVSEQMGNSAEQGLEAAELEERIEELIEELPEGCRRVFLLSRHEELSYKEIAERLSISVKTVEAQMGKALKHLRTGLSDVLISSVLAAIIIEKLIGVVSLWNVI